MKVVCPELLAEFRSAPKCELCGRWTPNGAEPHHLVGRGHGGGCRLDVRKNIVALCLYCHRARHDGNIPQSVLLAIVANREGVSVEDIREAIWKLQQTPKK